MQRFFLGVAGFSGFLAICLGAFAAHGLKHRIDSDSLAIWQTGVDYHIYHALGLLFISLLWQQRPSKALKLAGFAFIIGSLLFSGSLYAIAIGAPHAFGLVTPIGGTGFLVGWGALLYHAGHH